MQLQVKTLTGKIVPVIAELTDTVLQLKQKVEDEEGIPPTQQRLIYNGRQMEDDRTLDSYAVTPALPIHLVLRLRRVRKELMDLRKRFAEQEETMFSFSPKNSFVKDDFRTITDGEIPIDLFITMRGPAGTPYEGGEFEIHIQFPLDYPFKPFRMQFVTFIWSRFVDDTGRYFCGSLRSDNWSPALTISKILDDVREKFVTPPSDIEIYGKRIDEYKRSPAAFDRKARYYTQLYCLPDWRPEIHHVFPEDFRKEVRMLLLVHHRLSARQGAGAPQTPRLMQELLFLIIGFLARPKLL